MENGSVDEDALLRAITRSPEDLVSRLVYADWLTEHDRENQAEALRLSCRLVGLIRQLADVRQRVPAEWYARVEPITSVFQVVRVQEMPPEFRGVAGIDMELDHYLQVGELVPDVGVCGIWNEQVSQGESVGGEFEGWVLVARFVHHGELVRPGQAVGVVLRLNSGVDARAS